MVVLFMTVPFMIVLFMAALFMIVMFKTVLFIAALFMIVMLETALFMIVLFMIVPARYVTDPDNMPLEQGEGPCDMCVH